MRTYTLVVLGFCAVFVVLGVALLVRTTAGGGGVVGYVVGALFIVLGVARFTLERQRRS
jgi:TRAP-type mannitol/chloroaromatic compound transport system permease large subunit